MHSTRKVGDKPMEKLSDVRQIMSDGYVWVTDWFGILGDKGARVLEHRLVAALLLGRSLEEGEMVHHLDMDRSNNSPDNLVVVNPAEHGSFHRDGHVIKRKRAKRQISFSGKVPFVKMKCPWCGKVFYKRRSASVLSHDNKLHVNCCSRTCSNLLNDAVETGACTDLGRRVMDNVICEFNSNGPFMERFVNGQYPSQWFIDDNGVFHGDS